MSKWCGDENCLQCADKEPDPYVHLPREDYQALRVECERLRKALEVAGDDICSEYCGAGPCHKKCLAVQAALTPAAGGTRHHVAGH